MMKFLFSECLMMKIVRLSASRIFNMIQTLSIVFCDEIEIGNK